MTEITGILLAAGSARRFGAHKLLQPLRDGVTVAAAAAKTVHEVFPEQASLEVEFSISFSRVWLFRMISTLLPDLVTRSQECSHFL